MIHELKILPNHFANVISGEKTFEIRKFDRPFHKGDLLALNEYNADSQYYTGNSCLVYIDYIMEDAEFCKKDMVVMAIKPCAVYRYTEPFNPDTLCRDYTVPLATKGD